MSVLSTTNTVHYTGGDTPYDFTFKIFDPTDLTVILLTVATGESETLDLTDDYTVSAVNNDFSSGGTVTTVATYSSDYEIWIVRSVPYTQPSDLEEAGRIPSNTLDEIHDRIVIQIQQLYEIVARGFITQPWSEGFVVSDFISTFLDDEDAATARATLDVPSNDEAILDSLLTTDGDLIMRVSGVPARVPQRALVRARLTSVQSIGAASATVLALGTEVYDRGGDYNNTTYIFTVPRTGYYHITLCVVMDSMVAGKSIQITARKHGGAAALQYYGVSTGLTYSSCIVSGTLYLTAADEYEFTVYQNDTVSRNAVNSADATYACIEELF
jgi:hypothetical protein